MLANFVFGFFAVFVTIALHLGPYRCITYPPTTTPYFQSRFPLQNIAVCKQEMLANLLFVVLRFLLTAALHSEP